MQPDPQESAYITGFVYKEGTKLKLNGYDFKFQGSNLYDLAILNGLKSESRVLWMVQQEKAQGIKVLRFWAFANGYVNGIQTPIQPKPYTLNETALVRLDYVLKCCRDNGIKVILPFVNYENEYGGMKFYVDNVLGTGKDKELFYSDANVKKAYRWYVNKIVNRRNTKTGVYYKDDPTILAWELANEPHTSDDYEKKRGTVPGDLVYNWLNEMAGYVNSLDSKHLITTGEEGYRTDGPTGTGNDWLNNGLKGVSFSKNAWIQEIDFMTIHVYPDNWNIPAGQWSWVLENFMNDRAKIAFARNKPIIIEESGFKKSYAYAASPQYGRDELLKVMSQRAYGYGFSGNMVWQYTPINVDDSGYDFDFNDNGAWAIRESAKLFK
jgi:mannan endo-1,4-beta-mannosidase